MSRKGIAAALLGIWFILSAIDFLQDADLIEYSTAEMDRVMEDVLDNFEQAIKASVVAERGVLKPSSLDPYQFCSDFQEKLSVRQGMTQGLRIEAKFSNKDFKPHSILQVFLI